MTIGDIPGMYFNAELFLRSLIFNSRIKFELTIIVTTSSDPYNWDVYEDRRITQYVKENHPILLKHSEVLASPACYTTHPNIRWKISPRAKVCAFVDADLLICKSLIPFCEATDNGGVNGLIAFDCPLDIGQWDELFSKVGLPKCKRGLTTWTRKECPATYFNYGNIIVPAELVETIGEELKTDIELLNSTMPSYFAGQIALTMTLERLRVPTHRFAIRYNFPDLYGTDINEQEFSEITIFHYMHRKSILTDFDSIALMQNDQLSKTIEMCCKETYSLMMI